MKGHEKLKIEKLLSRIESGDFDELDIDTLLVKLRDFSEGCKAFKEIAHFAAHTGKRDKGFIKSSLERNYLMTRFWMDYSFQGRMVNLEMFPMYVKRLLILQIDILGQSQLKKLGVTRAEARSMVSEIQENKLLDHVYITEVSEKQLKVYQELTNFLSMIEGVNQKAFINELVAIIKKNQLNFDEKLFVRQADKVTLCILLLLNDTLIEVPSSNPCTLRLSYDKPDDLAGDYGNLVIMSSFNIDSNPNKTIRFNIFKTSLRAVDYCDESMLRYQTSSEYPLIKILSLDQPLHIDYTSWKLKPAI